MIIIISYLPQIILNSWKSGTSINCFVWFTLLDLCFLHPMPISIVVHIHNGWIESSLVNLHFSPFVMLHFEPHFPHLKQLDSTPAIIVLKLIWPKLVLGMVDIVLQPLLALPTPFLLNTCVTSNLLIILPLHDLGIFHMRAFILTWSWRRGPPTKVEGLPSLAFSTTKPCTSFKCFVNNCVTQYATMQLPTLHFHFDPTFVHSLSFWAKLGGQGGAMFEKHGRFQMLDFNKKISKNKSLLCN